jgi:hypothetical protein
MIGVGNRRRIWHDFPAILDIGKMKSSATLDLQRVSNIDTYIINWKNVKMVSDASQSLNKCRPRESGEPFPLEAPDSRAVT